MSAAINRRRLAYLWPTNFVVLVCCVIAATLVDSNGRLPGMGENASSILALLGLILGTGCNVLLFLFGKKADKVAAVVILFVYFALAIPAIMP